MEMEGKKRQDCFTDLLLQWQVPASGTELSWTHTALQKGLPVFYLNVAAVVTGV